MSHQPAPDLHITMQPRCPMCLAEQHGSAVEDFSYQVMPCSGCGEYTHTMTRTQYRAALMTALMIKGLPDT